MHIFLSLILGIINVIIMCCSCDRSHTPDFENENENVYYLE